MIEDKFKNTKKKKKTSLLNYYIYYFYDNLITFPIYTALFEYTKVIYFIYYYYFYSFFFVVFFFCLIFYFLLQTSEQLLSYSLYYTPTNHPPRHLFEISIQSVVSKCYLQCILLLDIPKNIS